MTPADTKTRTLTIRLTESERSDLDCLAAIDRKTVSSYVRGLVLTAARMNRERIIRFLELAGTDDPFGDVLDELERDLK